MTVFFFSGCSTTGTTLKWQNDVRTSVMHFFMYVYCRLRITTAITWAGKSLRRFEVCILLMLSGRGNGKGKNKKVNHKRGRS